MVKKLRLKTNPLFSPTPTGSSVVFHHIVLIFIIAPLFMPYIILIYLFGGAFELTKPTSDG